VFEVGNGIWDEGEEFTDVDGNEIWDEGEEFTDVGNRIWDEGEEFTDNNGNEKWDEAEQFTDADNSGTWDDRRSNGIYYGLLLVVLVGLVIIGGIKRIGQVTEKIVPSMVMIYVAASLYIILSNYSEIPNVVKSIFTQAFYPDAIYGGFLGVLVVGIRRAVFSNEGGVGSASIAHSAAKTDEPVREGIVAMIGPFIDTIIVCLMTATVILITADKNPIYQNLIAQDTTGTIGASMTAAAFGSAISWFPWILMIVVFLFSYSTMILPTQMLQQS
jgi:Na+/alanine symporter